MQLCVMINIYIFHGFCFSYVESKLTCLFIEFIQINGNVTYDMQYITCANHVQPMMQTNKV